jgi:hypothetical protein
MSFNIQHELGGWAKQQIHAFSFPWNLKASYIFGSALGTVLELPPHAYVNLLIA